MPLGPTIDDEPAKSIVGQVDWPDAQGESKGETFPSFSCPAAPLPERELGDLARLPVRQGLGELCGPEAMDALELCVCHIERADGALEDARRQIPTFLPNFFQVVNVHSAE